MTRDINFLILSYSVIMQSPCYFSQRRNQKNRLPFYVIFVWKVVLGCPLSPFVLLCFHRNGWHEEGMMQACATSLSFLCRWFCLWCSFIFSLLFLLHPLFGSFGREENERTWANLSPLVLFTSFLYCKEWKGSNGTNRVLSEKRGREFTACIPFEVKGRPKMEVLTDFVSLSLLLLLLLLCISTCFSYTSSSLFSHSSHALCFLLLQM